MSSFAEKLQTITESCRPIHTQVGVLRASVREIDRRLMLAGPLKTSSVKIPSSVIPPKGSAWMAFSGEVGFVPEKGLMVCLSGVKALNPLADCDLSLLLRALPLLPELLDKILLDTQTFDSQLKEAQSGVDRALRSLRGDL
jgi:hypothetical protein